MIIGILLENDTGINKPWGTGRGFTFFASQTTLPLFFSWTSVLIGGFESPFVNDSDDEGYTYTCMPVFGSSLSFSWTSATTCWCDSPCVSDSDYEGYSYSYIPASCASSLFFTLTLAITSWCDSAAECDSYGEGCCFIYVIEAGEGFLSEGGFNSLSSFK